MTRTALLSVVLLALVAQPAHAQVDAPDAPYPVFETADRENWLLRVSSISGATIEGQVRAVDDDAVELDGGRVALGDVTRIERGERVGGGARTGMIAGSVLVGSLFLAASFAFSDESDFDVGTAGPVALAGVAVGAILGGVLGADLDPARTEWWQVWPARNW